MSCCNCSNANFAIKSLLSAKFTKCLMLLTAAAMAMAMAAAGCGGPEVRPADTREMPIDLYTRVVDGTVGSMATLEGGGRQSISGYGLVVGLAGKGSSQVPSLIRKKMVQEMGRMGLGDPDSKSRMLSPDKFLNDLDTAVVMVTATTTAGMPAGSPLDVEISAIPGGQSINLQGGILYKTFLRQKSQINLSTKESLPLGSARGEILVNPFIDASIPAQAIKLQRGRIPGGGELIGYRPVWLALPRADYGMANMLQNAINSRFPSHPQTAVAKNATTIEINIPDKWKYDYEHFLDILTHLYVRRGGPFMEMKMRALASDILKPDAPGEHIALIWEGMDRQILPIIKPLLTSDNEMARFYAARTGTRLDDRHSAEALAEIALKSGRYQIEAITELGRSETGAGALAIKQCFELDDDLVRIAAFHAMLDCGLVAGVKYSYIDESFELYTIPTKSRPFIYATRSSLPAIVLFGEDIPIRKPICFSSRDGVITINSNSETGLMDVYRRIGAQNKLSGVLQCPYKVEELIHTLGGTPEPDDSGKVRGLGLTYSQVAAALNWLCNTGENSNIPAEFVLQKPLISGTITATRPEGGRANSAED